MWIKSIDKYYKNVAKYPTLQTIISSYDWILSEIEEYLKEAKDKPISMAPSYYIAVPRANAQVYGFHLNQNKPNPR